MSQAVSRGEREALALLLLLVQVLVLSGWTAPSTRRDEDVPNLECVAEAVEVLAEELIARRDPERDWEPPRPVRGEVQQKGGRTALALLALLEVGRSLQEPGLRDALERLASTTHDGTYTLSLRIMLFARLTEKWRGHLEHDVALLLGGFSGFVNGWGYRPAPEGRRLDNSATQFAALALRDAAERGVEIPAELWLRLERRFLATQLADGSWDYAGEGRPRASMTAAAIATLAIVRQRIHRDEYDDGPSRRVQPLEDAIERGLAWLDEHFDPAHNHGHSGHVPYYLFAIERAAHATGRIRFGNREWLLEAAQTLLERSCAKRADGGLRARKGRTPSTPDLALTLLFLQRGLLGNVIGELPAIPQLHRPLAVGTLSEHLAARLESRLGWIRLPTHDAHSLPAVLWLDLATRPDVLEDPTSAEFERIKNAVRSGCMLLCSVPGARGQTRVAATQLVSELTGTELVAIRRGNPLLSEPWPVRTVPPSFEVTNGVRTLAVFVGGDPARALQRGGREADRAIDLLANACLRGHGGEPPRPHADPDDPSVRHGTDRPFEHVIAHLAPQGHAIPEPGALDAFNARMKRTGGRTCTPQLGELGILEPSTESAVAILSGTDRWEPTQEDWAAIESWLQQGVPVVVETSGGSGDFSDGFAEMAKVRYPDPINPIENLDALIGPSCAGDLDFQRVAWTPESLRRFGVGTHAHHLERIRTPHPGPLILARFDLTHALLARAASGVHGWRTPWADALLARLLRRRMNEMESDP